MSDSERLKEIMKALAEPFPADAHQERKLKGGKTWWFVSWHHYRDRLDAVVPEANVSYSHPAYLGEHCHISCTIEILGVRKESVGCVPISEKSDAGNEMTRGTPVDRARAEAYKNACEEWGICRYLDDQTDQTKQQAFIRYMRSQGEGLPYKRYLEETGQLRPVSSGAKPFGQSQSVKTASKPRSATKTAAKGEISRDEWLRKQQEQKEA